jgi:hypothetical protein
MPKTFNVEQLRLNGQLLTGNSAGELFYDGQPLANGDTAVPLGRLIIAGDALKHADKVSDSEDLSAHRTLHVMVDESTIDINASDKLMVPTGGIGYQQLHATSIAGAGLAGGQTAPLSVVGGSGIVVASDAVNIPETGVTATMLLGSIPDSKLNNIVSVGKVEGSAIQLNGTTLVDLASNGLALNTNSVGITHIQSAVAGTGLQGGNGSAIRVGAGAGLEVDSTTVGIVAGGVTSDMLEGSIADSKLATITTAGKVDGGAVQLNANGLEDDEGLGIKNSGVVGTMIHPNTAGAGLGGGGVAGALVVNAGSGILVQDDEVNIDESGVITSMIRDGNVTNDKLGTNLSIAKTDLAAGDGLNLNSNTLSVDLATAPGLEFDGGDLRVNQDVILGKSSATQTLSGNYTFSNTLVLSSGITVAGDLQVQGTTLVTEQNQVNIGDDIIVLNADYPGDDPPDAGIEIERGTLTNAKFLFDDTDHYWVAGIGSDKHRVDTKKYSRSYGVEMTKDATQHKLSFGHTFESLPNVVVSLQHTGKHNVTNPDLLGAMVTKVYTTGVWVDFTNELPHSGYYLNAYAAVA